MSKSSKQYTLSPKQNWVSEMDQPRFFTKHTLIGIPYLIAVGTWKLAQWLLWALAIGDGFRLIASALGLAEPLAENDLMLAYLAFGWVGIAILLKLLSRVRKKDLR